MRAQFFRRRPRGSWTLLAVAALTTTAALADGPPPAGDDRGPGGVRLRLNNERLAPSVSVELEAFAVFHNLIGPDGEPRDHVLLQQLNDQIERGARSVTRKTVRNHLLEAIHLDRGIDQLREGLRADSLGHGALDFSFGFHSARPEVSLRYRLQPGSLRFRIGADGEVGLHFRSTDSQAADFGAIWDGHDTLTVRARLGF